jgi:signal peptidase I
MKITVSKSMGPSALDLWKKAGRVIDVRIEGSSMWPLMRIGDSVSLRLMDGDGLKAGDLLAFWKDGAIVVHRLINKKSEEGVHWLCQKGDNLSGWSWLPEDEVLGKVESIRGQGKSIDLNTRPWTWINRVMGISWFFWVSAVEKTCLLKVYVAAGRPLPILGGLASRMGGLLNATFGSIIIKAAEGGAKRS